MFRLFFLSLILLIVIVQSGCQNDNIPIPNSSEFTTITIIDYRSRSVIKAYTDQNKIKEIVEALNTFKASGLSEPMPKPNCIIVLKGKQEQMEVSYIKYTEKDVIFIQGEKHEWVIDHSIEDILFDSK